MRSLRMSRKQKTVGWLTLLLLCLLLAAWMLEFPAWSTRKLLERTERTYFLEDSQLLFTGSRGGGHTAYARNGTVLLVVNYLPTPLGLHQEWSDLYDTSDGIYCTTDHRTMTEFLAFGDMRGAARAELEITLEVALRNQPPLLRETYLAEGVSPDPDCFLFALTPLYREDDNSQAAEIERSVFAGERVAEQQEISLRLFDSTGKLLYIKTMDHTELDGMLHWPEAAGEK